MLLSGYDKQNNITNRLAMPVDVVSDTCFLNAITAETLQFYYWNSNVLTIDAGQAAGTVVIGKFAYSGILDSIGAMIGNALDGSIAFTTGTIFTTEVACDYSQIEAADNATLELIAIDLTENMANGEYCIDYRNGVLYGKKATTGVSDTVAYSVATAATGGGTSIAASINLAKIGNTAVVTAGINGLLAVGGNVAHDAVDTGYPMKIGGKAVTPTSLPAGVAALDRMDASIDKDTGAFLNYNIKRIDPVNDQIGVTPRDHSNINTTAYAASLVVKASAGKCFEVRGYNSKASTQFIQIHDAASLPANGTPPEEVIAVGASSNFSITFPPGKSFGVGIVVCNSSTGATKTIGSADCWISADFE